MAIVSKRTFWARVQEAMRDAGHKPTQKAVAVLVGIQQPSVHKWTKTGHAEHDNVLILAAKLRVCVEWLYTERGPKRPMNTEKSALVDLYDSLASDRLREKAMSYLEGLAGAPPPDESQAPRPRPHLS